MSHILVVDDDPEVRRFVALLLQTAGHTVVEASGGRQALDRLGREHPDLVLSDINMPGMDGIQMLMQIRQMEDKETLPVIMVSTEGSEERMSEAMELGASGYVLKPFTPERLVEQLKPLGLMPEAAEREKDDVDLSDPDTF